MGLTSESQANINSVSGAGVRPFLAQWWDTGLKKKKILPKLSVSAGHRPAPLSAWSWAAVGFTVCQ